MSPCWFWRVDQVQPWPLCFPQHPCTPAPPPAPLLLGHPDQNHAMPWHDMDITMPSSPPLTSNMHHLVQDLPLSLLVVLDPALSQGDNDRSENWTCSDAPRQAMPRQSAHGERPGRASPPARPDDSVLLSPPFLHPPAHLDVSNRLDKPIGPREPRTRRRHHRRPPQYCELRSRARPRQSLVFTAVKPYVLAVTSPSQERHRQCLPAPVATSPPLTSSPDHGHLPPL